MRTSATDIAAAATAAGLTPIGYRGRLAAAAGRERVYLIPAISCLNAGDPLLRFVAAMCLYARDIHEGAVRGPYDAAAAELYARSLLIPDAAFQEWSHESDEQLAERFRVPVEQISMKRIDSADEQASAAD